MLQRVSLREPQRIPLKGEMYYLFRGDQIELLNVEENCCLIITSQSWYLVIFKERMLPRSKTTKDQRRDIIRNSHPLRKKTPPSSSVSLSLCYCYEKS